MKEINYYLKKHMISTVIATILFVVQGLCVVGLITYVNNTIDVGLVRYGYEDVSPEALLQGSFEQRLVTLNEDEQAFVRDNYTLLDKSEMTVEEYQNYEKSYPVIASEIIYKKNWIGIEELNQKLDSIFSLKVEEMLYEYLNLGMKPVENQKAFVDSQIKMMAISALIFAITFAGANIIVASISAKIGYEEREKLLEGGNKGLRDSLDLQDRVKLLSRRFYAMCLGVCAIIAIAYYVNDYLKSPFISEAHMVIWTISIVVFGVSIYSAISIRGMLNKGIFLVIKVMVLGAITALFGSDIALIIILGYAAMLSLLVIIRKLIKVKLKTLLAAHSENIDNIDGQMAFVIDKEDVAIEPVQLKKMVRSYLTNNEYLYYSSWMLELLENLDKAVVALFNFFGVIIVIAGFAYMYINMGLPMTMILPLLIVYNF